jgi:hypothetical protein
MPVPAPLRSSPFSPPCAIVHSPASSAVRRLSVRSASGPHGRATQRNDDGMRIARSPNHTPVRFLVCPPPVPRLARPARPARPLLAFCRASKGETSNSLPPPKAAQKGRQGATEAGGEGSECAVACAVGAACLALSSPSLAVLTGQRQSAWLELALATRRGSSEVERTCAHSKRLLYCLYALHRPLRLASAARSSMRRSLARGCFAHCRRAAVEREHIGCDGRAIHGL